MGTRSGPIWLRIGTGGGLLWMQWWNFRFHEMRGISWLAEDLLASQGELLVYYNCGAFLCFSFIVYVMSTWFFMYGFALLRPNEYVYFLCIVKILIYNIYNILRIRKGWSFDITYLRVRHSPEHWFHSGSRELCSRGTYSNKGGGCRPMLRSSHNRLN